MNYIAVEHLYRLFTSKSIQFVYTKSLIEILFVHTHNDHPNAILFFF